MEETPQKNQAPARAALSLTKIIVYVIYLIAVFIEVMLLLRVVLLYFGANPIAPFVQFVYNVSEAFMTPFRGIFPAHVSGLTGGYIDTSALFAALIYLIIVAVIQSVLYYLDSKK